jgi:peptidoglycan-associated lipoprotein
MHGRVQFCLTVALTAAVGACATRGNVKSRVAAVNDQVESISQSLEKTQEQVRQNTGRISDVSQALGRTDKRADAAVQSSQQAVTASRQALAQAEAIERRQKQIVSEVVLAEDAGGFGFDQATLPSEAKSEIDQLVQEMRAKPQGGYIEIEGHTDSTGPRAYNEELGLERAQTAKEYIHDHYELPLHKISVISYGEEKPIASNATRAGRAKNRRVVLRLVR